MKFCPYCGASLVGGAVSFCAECGRQIPIKETTDAPKTPPKPQPKWKKQSVPPPKRKRPSRQPPRPLPKAPPKRRKNPMDIAYDGYYNDIQPIDAGQQGERMDPDMIKKVVLLLIAAVLIIVLAAALMMLL